jgi:hypothetical protein
MFQSRAKCQIIEKKVNLLKNLDFIIFINFLFFFRKLILTIHEEMNRPKVLLFNIIIRYL